MFKALPKHRYIAWPHVSESGTQMTVATGEQIPLFATGVVPHT